MVRQLQKNRMMLLGYTERKLERRKPSKGFIWPPLLEIIKKNVFLNTLTARGGPRRISCLYWMQWIILPPRVRLRFSMPSLLLPLVVRPVINRVFSPLSWKTWMGSRLNPPITQDETVSKLLLTQTATSPWG